jgi:hypothetical protein
MSAAEEGFDLSDHALGRPLSYPGRAPRTSGLLVESAFSELRPVADGRAGRYRVSGHETASLDDLLRDAGVATVDARSAVLAIGSNASPAQLSKKFTTRGVSTVVPMTLAMVSGLDRGYSAHVSPAGYVPITPVQAPACRAQCFILWLDPAQLRALDQTEPNYDRRTLTVLHEATLESNERLTDVGLYVSRWGHLLSADGTPLRPGGTAPQRLLLEALIGRSHELRDLAGSTPEEFVSRAAASHELRDEIRRCFERHGWVGDAGSRSMGDPPGSRSPSGCSTLARIMTLPSIAASASTAASR